MALGLNGEYWNVVFGVEKESVIQFGRGAQFGQLRRTIRLDSLTRILD